MPAARLGSDTAGARDARRLSTLLEISQALSGTLNFVGKKYPHLTGEGRLQPGEHDELEFEEDAADDHVDVTTIAAAVISWCWRKAASSTRTPGSSHTTTSSAVPTAAQCGPPAARA